MMNFSVKMLFLILCLTGFQCRAQTETKELVEEEPLDLPYLLVRDDMFLVLSRELREDFLTGLVGLTVYLDSSGHLLGFEIKKVKIDFNHGSDLNFVNKSIRNEPTSKDQYPIEIKKFYSEIESYVKEIRFKRDDKVVVKAINELTFITVLK